MKMSELEKRTGVHRETIRVLMRRGLLPKPEKPKPTVAHYTEEHVQAITAIRQLQVEYRMTLSQIAKILQGRPLDQRMEANAFSHLEQLVAARVGVQDQKVPVDSLTTSNPSAVTDAKAFESIGLVDRIKSSDGYLLSYTDARLVAIWGEMREAGFVESADFYPDMLDHYKQASEYLAHREAEKFLARTEGRIDEEEAATMLQKALPLMLDFFGLLRTKFFIRNIRHDPAQPEAGAAVHQRPRPELPAP